ncbi:MAG TPA: protein kinase [Collinsella ihuae]|uniref:non-specific serine/threonine protein kinase n=1 Tax=Collinsella ihumii TaxID=1720204 RepID=A0A921LSX6_9ACTN|nr:protein kinase [Collinsella ihumii]
MNDDQVMHGMSIDDAYQVERVLSMRRGFITELVTLDGSGPFIRKKMPLDQTNRAVWALLASCGCLRLPQVVASYELPDKYVVVCSCVPGETLATRLEQRGCLTEPEAVGISLDLCEAAGSLHAHGIVHCDIAPSNIVLAADGAHPIDMGIARMMSDPVPPQGARMGTRGCASPEQCFAAADERSDVYGIGRVLGAMVTGVHPDDERYASLLADESVVSPSLRVAIERATAFEPSSRYASADALADALRGERGGDTAPDVAEKGGRARKVPTAKPLVLPIVGIAMLCVVGVVLVASGLLGRKADANRGQDATFADDAMQDEVDDSPTSTGVLEALDMDDASSGNDSAIAQEAREALVVSESWWSPRDNGYFEYLFALTNTSDSVTVDYPMVRITGRDAAGAVVTTIEDGVMAIAPGQTVYKFGIRGSGTLPAEVEFSTALVTGSFAHEQVDAPSAFSITGLNASSGTFGTSFIGELTAEHLGSDAEIASSAAVTVVLRDEAGAIVGGTTEYCQLPSEGETVPFESTPLEVPAYASMEAHAIPW